MFGRRADDRRVTSNRKAHFADGIVGGGDAFASQKPKPSSQVTGSVARAQEAQWGGQRADLRQAKSTY